MATTASSDDSRIAASRAANRRIVRSEIRRSAASLETEYAVVPSSARASSEATAKLPTVHQTLDSAWRVRAASRSSSSRFISARPVRRSPSARSSRPSEMALSAASSPRSLRRAAVWRSSWSRAAKPAPVAGSRACWRALSRVSSRDVRRAAHSASAADRSSRRRSDSCPVSR